MSRKKWRKTRIYYPKWACYFDNLKDKLQIKKIIEIKFKNESPKIVKIEEDIKVIKFEDKDIINVRMILFVI